MMLDEKLAHFRTHRDNIHRYRRLLKTKLSTLEREFIERRLAEEEAAVEYLRVTAFPLTLAASAELGSASKEL